ncbi:MAG: response regulator [Candidatus Moranbacteria bacterium]|nr:response regulator [Candidatus Moranbacteria bacterium]
MSLGHDMVLIADDDENQRRALGKILSRSGYVVSLVANGEDALRIFEEKDCMFDLIITDFCMPIEGDGLKLLHNIRKLSDVPMVLVTGSSVGEVEYEKLQSFFNDLAAKPVSSERLVAIVNELIVR